MKKKYYSPEMEELEVEMPVLLEGSCADETQVEGEQAGEDPVSDF